MDSHTDKKKRRELREPQFHCSSCNRNFSSQENLDAHTEGIHGKGKK